MEDFVYWRLSLELNDLVENPHRFVQALEAIFGEAGAAVYEYKLVEEVQKEFNLIHTVGKEELAGKKAPGQLFREEVKAAWMASQLQASKD